MSSGDDNRRDSPPSAPYRTPVGQPREAPPGRRTPARMLSALATLTELKGEGQLAQELSTRASHARSDEVREASDKAAQLRRAAHSAFAALHMEQARAFYVEALSSLTE